MTPSAMEARPDVSLARKPAPGVLPTQMPTSIGQNRRTRARNLPPGERLPRIGAEVRHHQQSGRLARRHHQGQEAGRNRRQSHADEALDEAGEQERPERNQENGQRHSEQRCIPSRWRRAYFVRTTSRRPGQAVAEARAVRKRPTCRNCDPIVMGHGASAPSPRAAPRAGGVDFTNSCTDPIQFTRNQRLRR